MFLLDYIIIFSTITSVFLGLFRGFIQEFISSYFWFFNFYFFNEYYYFTFFYTDAFQSSFLKDKILVLTMIIIFLFLKNMLNYLLKKIIYKNQISYYNTILGVFFGILRSVVLIFLFLFVFNYFNKNSCDFYIKNSRLMFIFFKIIDYFEFL